MGMTMKATRYFAFVLLSQWGLAHAAITAASVTLRTASEAASETGPDFASAAISGSDSRGGSGSASASASAIFGTLKVKAESDSSGFVTSLSSGFATFEDRLTVTSPGYAGYRALAYVPVQFSWSQSASFDGHTTSFAAAGFSFRINDWYSERSEGVTSGRFESSDVTYASDNFATVPFSHSVFVPVDLVIGQPILVYFALNAVANTSADPLCDCGSGRALTDASHSAYWGGIQSVVVDGQAIPFSVTSDSGTDWSQSFIPSPVPEPSSLLLLLAGIFGLALRSRP
jgi:hypothetical protein